MFRAVHVRFFVWKAMPIYTFYAYIGYKGARVPILTIDHFPHDWAELRELLLDVVRTAYNEHGVIEATYALERHVSSRFLVWRQRIGSYQVRPFTVKREPEAYFTLVYNPNNDTMTVREARFSPKHKQIREDFKFMERGIPPWEAKMKPIVPENPKSFLEDPKLLVREASQLRYPDYSKTFKPHYDNTSSPSPFEHTHQRIYLPRGLRIHEAKKEEKQE